MATAISVQNFKGWRNDGDAKQVPSDFLYETVNFDYRDDGITGIKKTLMPERIKQLTSRPIDGFSEFSYLDDNNVLHKEQVFVSGGSVIACDDIEFFNTEQIKNGLEDGICSFVVHNDILYIANGKNYVQMYNGNVCTEMGAPFAEIQNVISPTPLAGFYTYKMTYLFQTGIDGGGNPIYGNEEVLGSSSNSLEVVGQAVKLTLPIGYSGVAARRIYRNTQAYQNQFVLLTQINDNTTLTYTDIFSDASIQPNPIIPPVNNELPKPKYLRVANQILFGCGDSTLPTQMFNTDTDLTIFDSARFIDVSNFGNDNTALNGLGYDYNQLVTGTDKNIIFVNPNPNVDGDGNLSFSVTYTRANVGILDGHSVQRISAFGSFPGGLVFVSTERDVRLIVGNQAISLTTLDNITSDNYSQFIRKSLSEALQNYDTLCSAFYNYKYYLCIDGKTFVFDIRIQGWMYHDIGKNDVRSEPTFLGVMNGKLYNGQPDGWLEAENSSITYRDVEIPAYIRSPQMFVSTEYKMVTTMKMWFIGAPNNNIEARVFLDDNQRPIHADFEIIQGVFSKDFYNENFYDISKPMDYKNFNINYDARWVRYELRVNSGMCDFQGFSIYAETGRE